MRLLKSFVEFGKLVRHTLLHEAQHVAGERETADSIWSMPLMDGGVPTFLRTVPLLWYCRDHMGVTMLTVNLSGRFSFAQCAGFYGALWGTVFFCVAMCGVWGLAVVAEEFTHFAIP